MSGLRIMHQRDFGLCHCTVHYVLYSSSIERVVEDLVQEAMQRGEFANLRGAGRPLPYDADGHSLFVDRTELALNRILARQGFVPEWVQLRRTIRSP